jgi:hypothetical protein
MKENQAFTPKLSSGQSVACSLYDAERFFKIIPKWHFKRSSPWQPMTFYWEYARLVYYEAFAKGHKMPQLRLFKQKMLCRLQ